MTCRGGRDKRGYVDQRQPEAQELRGHEVVNGTLTLSA